MSENSATVELMIKLEEILKTITKANGYLTDAGKSVHVGWYAHVLAAEDTKFPAIVLHPPSEDPLSVQGGNKVGRIRADFALVMGDQVEFDKTAYHRVMNVARDVRRAIYFNRYQLTEITNDEAVEVGTTEPEMGTDASVVMAAIPVSIEFNEHYQ